MSSIVLILIACYVSQVIAAPQLTLTLTPISSCPNVYNGSNVYNCSSCCTTTIQLPYAYNYNTSLASATCNNISTATGATFSYALTANISSPNVISVTVYSGLSCNVSQILYGWNNNTLTNITVGTVLGCGIDPTVSGQTLLYTNNNSMIAVNNQSNVCPTTSMNMTTNTSTNVTCASCTNMTNVTSVIGCPLMLSYSYSNVCPTMCNALLNRQCDAVQTTWAAQNPSVSGLCSSLTSASACKAASQCYTADAASAAQLAAISSNATASCALAAMMASSSSSSGGSYYYSSSSAGSSGVIDTTPSVTINQGAIIGGVIGGFVGCACIILILRYFMRRPPTHINIPALNKMAKNDAKHAAAIAADDDDGEDDDEEEEDGDDEEDEDDAETDPTITKSGGAD